MKRALRKFFLLCCGLTDAREGECEGEDMLFDRRDKRSELGEGDDVAMIALDCSGICARRAARALVATPSSSFRIFSLSTMIVLLLLVVVVVVSVGGTVVVASIIKHDVVLLLKRQYKKQTNPQQRLLNELISRGIETGD